MKTGAVIKHAPVAAGNGAIGEQQLAPVVRKRVRQTPVTAQEMSAGLAQARRPKAAQGV